MSSHTHGLLSITATLLLAAIFLPGFGLAATNNNVIMECPHDDALFASPQGQFHLDICTPTAEKVAATTEADNERPALAQLRFIHGKPANEIITTWPFEIDMLSATCRAKANGLMPSLTTSSLPLTAKAPLSRLRPGETMCTLRATTIATLCVLTLMPRCSVIRAPTWPSL